MVKIRPVTRVSGQEAALSSTGGVSNSTAEALLSLNSPSVSEGDSGTTTLTFVLSRGADGQGMIGYRAKTTAVGTATPGVDFAALIETGTIAASGSVDIDVTVYGDTDEESDETVQLEVVGAFL
jgi:hypothetical protein